MMKKKVKIFGLPRTCTNLVEVLLRRNFDVDVMVSFPEWKHGERRGQRNYPPGTRFVMCTKHPYKWLPSFWAYENILRRSGGRPEVTLQEFIRTPTLIFGESWTPIAAFNILIRSWLAIPDVVQVRQESLAADQTDAIIMMGSHLGLDEARDPIELVRNRMNTHARATNEVYEAPRRGPAGILTNEDRKFVDKGLGVERANAPVHGLGYKMESEVIGV